MTDALTGLGNRRRLTTDLRAAFEDGRLGRSSLLLLFDLDGFKAYNDTFGHLAGDELLARLGAEAASRGRRGRARLPAGWRRVLRAPRPGRRATRTI